MSLRLARTRLTAIFSDLDMFEQNSGLFKGSRGDLNPTSAVQRRKSRFTRVRYGSQIRIPKPDSLFMHLHELPRTLLRWCTGWCTKGYAV